MVWKAKKPAHSIGLLIFFALVILLLIGVCSVSREKEAGISAETSPSATLTSPSAPPHEGERSALSSPDSESPRGSSRREGSRGNLANETASALAADEQARSEAQTQARNWMRLARLEATDAFFALKSAGGAQAERAVLALLAVDGEERSDLVAPVLETIGALAPALSAAQREALSQELTSRISRERTRTEARESLGNIVLLLETVEAVGSPAATAPLCEHLATLEDPVLQDAVVRALAKVADASGRTCVERFLSDIEERKGPAREPEALAYAASNARAALEAIDARTRTP